MEGHLGFFVLSNSQSFWFIVKKTFKLTDIIIIDIIF